MLSVCQHCDTAYAPEKSTSRYLRMTFCTALCEGMHNGATIEDMLRWERDRLITIRAMREAYRKAHPDSKRSTYWDWFKAQKALLEGDR